MPSRSRIRPRQRVGRRLGALALSVAVAATLAACGAVKGTGSPGAEVQAANVPASALPIIGDGGTTFDQETRNALTDIEQFWKQAYPTIANGQALKPLSGGVYSVETGKPNRDNKCMDEQPTAADNNAFYCQLDDTFAYDRVGLVKVIADQLGQNFVPLVFAHEFGHLIQERTGLLDRSSILLESQADCASGAFMAAEAGVSSIKLTDKHFNVDPKGLDRVMLGMILLRDRSPHDVSKVGSHGNGFDRLSAFSDGFNGGVTKCYSSDWTSRQFTERDYTSDADRNAGGNLPFDQIVDGSANGSVIPDLNRFWTGAFKSINKTFNPVKVKAGAPPCAGKTGSEFAYCPSDNTVYYDTDTAKAVYYSVPVLALDANNNVSIEQNSAGDYALGAVFAYAWGFAVRSQVGLSIDDTAAMLGAACYTGAYSEDINVTTGRQFTLSPQDMDEASVAVLRDVPLDQIFGARNTTGFQRIDSFKKGYFGTLTACSK